MLFIESDPLKNIEIKIKEFEFKNIVFVGEDANKFSTFITYKNCVKTKILKLKPDLIIFDLCEIYSDQCFELIYTLQKALNYWFIFRTECKAVDRVLQFFKAEKLGFPTFLPLELNRFKVLKYTYNPSHLYLIGTALSALTYKSSRISNTTRYSIDLLHLDPLYWVCQELFNLRFQKLSTHYTKWIRYYYLNIPLPPLCRPITPLIYQKITSVSSINLAHLNIKFSSETCVLTKKPDFKQYLEKTLKLNVYLFVEFLNLSEISYKNIVLLLTDHLIESYLFNDEKFKNCTFYYFEKSPFQIVCDQNNTFSPLCKILCKFFKHPNMDLNYP
ncbi:hypothetical protein LDVICp059 [lymphocystis disease virus-China]|uniref:Uncharacterized protein n=2 Tax=Lymphocystis disease virus 2 TaxID=159183 RepID=A0A6F8X2F8_9VIRU|nr:hypothetical protein LDVICp059 [lymphocystis disease virus-China]AAU10905.1 hypothetical protein [lymphocystis disease virus-China]BCB67446.1 hypothetical protein [Lymphocystis disease virus 2]